MTRGSRPAQLQTRQETPISKVTRAKQTGGAVQVVKALSSNPSTKKKKKKKTNYQSSNTGFEFLFCLLTATLDKFNTLVSFHRIIVRTK
jgi:hypothetical protein